MYQKEEVEWLAKEYVETEYDANNNCGTYSPDLVFEALIKALEPLINVQLGKNYSSLKPFWNDLKQEVLLKIYKNRGNLGFTKTKLYARHYYARIQTHLFRAAKKVKGKFNKEKNIARVGYDSYNPDIKCLEELSIEEKRKLGIEPIEEENYD